MTWSFRLVNGDIAKGRKNSLAVTKGSDKVAQDLIAELREPMGTNPVTPSFGSLLEEEEGSTLDVGEQTFLLPPDYISLVISEAERIIGQYQERQFVRLRYETDLYGAHSFDSDEIITDFQIDATQSGTILYLQIVLFMDNGEAVDLSIPNNAPTEETL